MGNYNFRKDLSTAKNTEQEIAQLLLDKYGAIVKEIS